LDYSQFWAIAKAESTDNDKVARLARPDYYRHFLREKYIAIMVFTVRSRNECTKTGPGFTLSTGYLQEKLPQLCLFPSFVAACPVENTHRKRGRIRYRS